jgi:lipopolysaccharide export system protein LptC
VNQRWWLWLERAQAAVPLLAVAGLAGFTWWLVQSSPKVGGATRPTLAASTPDFVLNHARVARFDAQGRIEAVLDGREIRHFPDTDKLEIDQLRLSARDEQGQGLQAAALLGVADHRAEWVTLSGQARVVAMPNAATAAQAGLRDRPVHFLSERVRIDTRSRVVSADVPVTLQQVGSVVHAQSLHYDDRTGIADLGGRVRGHYDAPGQTPARP